MTRSLLHIMIVYIPLSCSAFKTGPAGSFICTGQVMTSCCNQSNYSFMAARRKFCSVMSL